MDELENKEQSLQDDALQTPAETKTEPEAVLEPAGEYTAESEAAAEEPASDAQTSQQNEAAPAMEDALVQELEGIRDLLQQELDKAGEEPLIQALDETQEEPQEDEAIPEEELCTCCGERRRDTSFGEDYPYCTECREDEGVRFACAGRADAAFDLCARGCGAVFQRDVYRRLQYADGGGNAL